MSRSPWASTEPSALAAVALRRAGEGARLVHRVRLGHRGLGVPGPARRRLLRVVVAIVPLAAAPAALAHTGSHRHAQHHSSSTRPAAVARTRRVVGSRRAALARNRLLRELRHDRHVVLAIGSGYGTAGGSPLVRALQIRLVHGGYAPGPIDGLYGPLTRASVTRFQAAHGLAIDGIAGPRTLAEMTARTPALYAGAGAVTGGAAGVRSLQRLLARAGDPTGPVDGIFGPRTERAVRDFQAANGLPATGIAGPSTLGRLRSRSTARRPATGRPRGHTRRPAPATGHTRRPHPAPTPRRAGHPAGAGQAQTGRPVPTPGWTLPAEIAAVGLLLLTGAWYLRRRRHERGLPERGAEHPSSATNAPAATDPGERAATDAGMPAPTGGRPEGSVAPAADMATPLGVETEFAQADQRAEARRAFNEAVRLEQQQDRAGARAAYRRADEAGHAGAACNLGVLLELEGLVPEARAAYARADARGDANGAFNLACLLDEQGDSAGALAAYQRADRRGHAEAATNLGVLLESRRLVAAARAAYLRAEQRGDPNGAANLGALLEELGERGAALDAYRRAEEMRARAVAQPAPAEPAPTHPDRSDRT